MQQDPQDNVLVFPAGARPSTDQTRRADVVVVGNEVVKDRHGRRRTLDVDAQAPAAVRAAAARAA